MHETAIKIFTLARMMREKIRESKSIHPLSLLHIRTLAIVYYKEEPTMKDVADELCITSPSATKIIERMVGEKYISRISDEKDRRIIRLKLTEKGKGSLNEGLKEAGKAMDATLTKLSEKEKKVFLGILNKIISD